MTASEPVERICTGTVRNRNERHTRSIGFLFALSLALASLPVLLTTYPPLFDYPNHLARIHILSAYDKVPLFRANFEISSYLIPNVLSDLVLLALTPIGGVLMAGKMLLLGTFALALSGAVALNFALARRLSVWPLFMATLLYNEMFFWGFLNYELGLAILLCALASWIHLGSRSRSAQLLVGTLFAVTVFFAHLVAFGLYAVAIAALEWRMLLRAWPGVLAAGRRLALSAAQFLPALLVFWMASPSSELRLEAAFDFSLFGKAMPFTRLLSSGNPALDLASMGLILLAVSFGLATGRVRADSRLLLVGALYLLLILSMPYTMLGSFFLDSRIVIALAMILLVSLVPRPGIGQGWVPVLILLACVGGRSLYLVQDWAKQDKDYERVVSALRALPEGSLVATAIGHEFELGDWWATRYVKPSHEHTANYATIERNALVPNVFARRGQNPLVFLPTLDAMHRASLNPVPRLLVPEDGKWMVEHVGPIADQRQAVFPPVAGLFIIAYHVPCSLWPADPMVRIVRCEVNFSLVEVLGSPTSSEAAGHPDEVR